MAGQRHAMAIVFPIGYVTFLLEGPTWGNSNTMVRLQGRTLPPPKPSRDEIELREAAQPADNDVRLRPQGDGIQIRAALPNRFTARGIPIVMIMG
mgnify:CR=1 FL=1